jgi:hypothetical protein
LTSRIRSSETRASTPSAKAFTRGVAQGLDAVITEALLKIGPSLAEQFAAPNYCSLQDKPGDHSLFAALACCEAIARAE